MFAGISKFIDLQSRHLSNAAGGAAGAASPVSTAQLLRLQQTVLEKTANAIVITDPQGTILWTNPAFTVLTGYSAEEAIGGTPRLLKSGRHDGEFYRELWDTISAGQTWRGDVANRRKDGSTYYGEQVITPVRGDGGDITHFVAVMNDVTVRREAETARRAAHQQLQHVLAHSPAVIYGAKLEGDQVIPHTMSENITRLLGFTVAEALSYDWWLGQLHPDDRARAVASISETLTQNVTAIEYRLRHRDGTYRWVEDHCQLVRNAAGEPAEFIGVLTDITGRKHSEEVLRSAAAHRPKQQARRITMDVGIMVTCTALVFACGQIFSWFEWIFALLAHEKVHPFIDEIVGTIGFVLLAMVVFSYRRWRESRAEAISQHNLAEAMRTLHSELDFRVQQRTAELARANEGLRAEVVERKRAEEALRLFRTLVDNSDDNFEVIDPETGRFLDVNKKACTESGFTREELLAMTVADVDPTVGEVGWANACDRIRQNGTAKGEGVHRRKDGTTFPIEFNARWVHLDRNYIVTVARDITRRKEAETVLRDSQALYHALVEQMPAAIFRKDRDGRYEFVNAPFCAVTGKAPADFLGRSARELGKKPGQSYPLNAGTAMGAAIFVQGDEHHARIMDGTERRIESEERWMMADGRIVHLQVVKTPVFDSEGRVIGSQGILLDITARKVAEASLQEQREQWQTLVAASTSALFVLQDSEVMVANPSAARLVGEPVEAVLGRNIFDFLHEDYHATVRGRMLQAQQQVESLPILEAKIRRRDGQVLDIESASVRFDFRGRPALLVEARDISARKQAEADGRANETRYRSLFDNMLNGFAYCRMSFEDGQPCDYTYLSVNRAFEKLTGLRGVEGKLVSEVMPGIRESDPALFEIYGRVASGGGPQTLEIFVAALQHWFAVSVYSPAPGEFVSVFDVITERKRAEARLRLQHAVTQMLSEASPSEQVNHRILETIARGLGSNVGELWMVDRAKNALHGVEISHPPSTEFKAFAEATRQFTFDRGAGLQGRVWAEDRVVWVPDIQQETSCPRRALIEKLRLRSWIGFPVKRRDQIVGVFGFFSQQVLEPDAALAATLLTLGSQFGQFLEKQQLTEQFQQAQKMEALGTLAGGVAHDFNNIIAGISGYTELAIMESTPGTDITAHLGAVLQCSARAAALVRQILAFSRHQENERHPIQLRHVVSEALNLLRASVPTTIDFETRIGRDLPTVLADANQIHQVVMNLGTNAWHAMRGRAGKLKVTLEACDVDAALAEIHPGLRPGRHVRLSVSDTGHGMDKATLDRIFEPFFTTKGPGEGTGLGLAVVLGVMQSHEGVVTVDSRPNEGTTFQLYFPASEQESTNRPVDTSPTPKGHGERILYVEDEEQLARMGQRVLERLGYVADFRTSPTAALDLVRADPGRYALVITDLTMPRLTGTEFAQELLKIRPDLPIILVKLVTGYAATLTNGQVHALGIRELLLKPLSVQSLGLSVARVLGTANPNQPCPPSS